MAYDYDAECRRLGTAHVTKAPSSSGSGSGSGPGLRQQRSMKFCAFGNHASPRQDPKQTPAYFAAPRAPYLASSPPVSPASPRWDSLANGHINPLKYHPTNSNPTSPVASSFRSVSPSSANEPHHSIDSIASETRDEFPPLPSTRKITNESPMLVENFSRPRNPSLKQPYHPDIPRSRISNHSQPESNQFDSLGNYPISWPRSRGPSISSNKSSSTFASLPVRPTHDLYGRESQRARGRQPFPPVSRPPISYGRAESSEPAYARDRLHHMASLPSDELRSSYRSQLTTSTAQGTVATERSSVLTQRSSATSVDDAVDDGLSVDDVMGMYEKGFADDSSPEDEDEMHDSRPGTAKSETNRRNTAVLEAMSDPLLLPRPAATFPGPETIVRDSAAIFRNSHLTSSSDGAGACAGTDADNNHQSDQTEQTSIEDDFEPTRPTRQHTNMTFTGEEDRDRYGFKKSNQYITREVYESWNNSYTDYLTRRRKKWVAFLKENGLMTDEPNRFPPRSAKAKRFVRKGIPPDWRGAAWFYYAGGPAILSKHAGVYDDLLKRPVKDVDVEAIERDLHRTFPDNIKFRAAQPSFTPAEPVKRRNSEQTVKDSLNKAQGTDETPMISSLRRVLHAFSVYNPRIGYCQSLNFLAGLLLLFVESEEQAFWLLNIITRVYLPGTHEMSLEGANVDLGVLMSSLREAMPNVWAKIGGELDGSDAVRPKSRRHRGRGEPTRLPPITLCMTAWFMSCFIGTLPIETTLRVWDVFFYEGSKTLFRIALAVFKIGEPEIKAVGDPMEIFQVVQTIPRRLIDANGLMEACFKRRNGFGHLSQETVEQKRQERRDQVKAEKEKIALGHDVVPEMEVRRKGTLFNRRKGKEHRTNPVEVM
ncbi:TBC domain-containing protein [Xylariaceae sp. FL0016]|nr:TBC domain-containing protein [Xylariaceae sp. FL0016]